MDNIYIVKFTQTEFMPDCENEEEKSSQSEHILGYFTDGNDAIKFLQDYYNKEVATDDSINWNIKVEYETITTTITKNGKVSGEVNKRYSSPFMEYGKERTIIYTDVLTIKSIPNLSNKEK